MPGLFKDGGSWKSVRSTFVKVGSTWRNVTTGYVKVAGQWVTWFSLAVLDNFNRTTTGTLGTSPTGSIWSTLRGTWFANGSAAQSDSAAGDYALAVVETSGVNQTVSAAVSGGTGPAFWVSDAGSWYAVQSYYNQTTDCTQFSTCTGCSSYTCSCGSSLACCGNCPCPSTCPQTCSVAVSGGYRAVCRTNQSGGCNYAMYEESAFGTCPDGQVYNYYSGGYYVTSEPGWATVVYRELVTTTTQTVNNAACPDSNTCCTTPCSCGDTCCCSYSYSCCVQYTTTTSYFMRLIRAVSNSVSQLAQVTLSGLAGAIKVITSGDTITATAYSDSGMTSPYSNTITNTPSSPVKGSRAGIIKAPSDFSQGSTVDNFSAEAQ